MRCVRLESVLVMRMRGELVLMGRLQVVSVVTAVLRVEASRLDVARSTESLMLTLVIHPSCLDHDCGRAVLLKRRRLQVAPGCQRAWTTARVRVAFNHGLVCIGFLVLLVILVVVVVDSGGTARDGLLPCARLWLRLDQGRRRPRVADRI